MARVYDDEREICGESFYTLWGMAKQVPGRTKGSHITPNTLLRYIDEGCPCFEHAGATYFKKDLSEFRAWLTTRRPERQKKSMARRARYQ
jgi:hypothetical protein